MVLERKDIDAAIELLRSKGKSSSVYRGLSEELKSQKEVALLAVNQNAMSLLGVPAPLNGDRDIVLSAAGKSEWALRYAAAEFCEDKQNVSDLLEVGKFPLLRAVLNKDEDKFKEVLGGSFLEARHFAAAMHSKDIMSLLLNKVNDTEKEYVSYSIGNAKDYLSMGEKIKANAILGATAIAELALLYTCFGPFIPILGIAIVWGGPLFISTLPIDVQGGIGFVYGVMSFPITKCVYGLHNSYVGSCWESHIDHCTTEYVEFLQDKHKFSDNVKETISSQREL